MSNPYKGGWKSSRSAKFKSMNVAGGEFPPEKAVRIAGREATTAQSPSEAWAIPGDESAPQGSRPKGE